MNILWQHPFAVRDSVVSRSNLSVRSGRRKGSRFRLGFVASKNRHEDKRHLSTFHYKFDALSKLRAGTTSVWGSLRVEMLFQIAQGAVFRHASARRRLVEPNSFRPVLQLSRVFRTLSNIVHIYLVAATTLHSSW